jgi:hypothetical protein
MFSNLAPRGALELAEKAYRPRGKKLGRAFSINNSKKSKGSSKRSGPVSVLGQRNVANDDEKSRKKSKSKNLTDT